MIISSFVINVLTSICRSIDAEKKQVESATVQLEAERKRRADDTARKEDELNKYTAREKVFFSKNCFIERLTLRRDQSLRALKEDLERQRREDEAARKDAAEKLRLADEERRKQLEVKRKVIVHSNVSNISADKSCTGGGGVEE